MHRLAAHEATTVARGMFDGFDAVTLAAGPLEATFVPDAGMVGASLRHDGDELLARPATLAEYVAHGTVLGIPVLHPWANRLSAERYEAAGRRVRLPSRLPREEHGLAIHGLRPAPWQLRHPAVAGAAAALVARLDFAGHPAFPFAHRVEQRVELSPQALRIETRLRAPAPVPVAFGFHPYLRVPEEAEVTLPTRRRLLERLVPTGEGVMEYAERRPLADRTFDDGYDMLGERSFFALAGDGREITVSLLRGYPVAQVFAPPGGEYVCFEPMTAPTDALVSGRGLRLATTFDAVFEIRVEEES
jgi:aldose 1-epimerase